MTERAADKDGRIESSHLHIDPEDEVLWEVVRPRNVSLEQWDRFQGYVSEIFGASGMDLETPSTSRTPDRFLKALLDSTNGTRVTPSCSPPFPRSAAVAPTVGSARSSKVLSRSSHCANTTRFPSTVWRTSDTTSFWRGTYDEDPELRRSFLQAVTRPR